MLHSSGRLASRIFARPTQSRPLRALGSASSACPPIYQGHVQEQETPRTIITEPVASWALGALVEACPSNDVKFRLQHFRESPLGCFVTTWSLRQRGCQFREVLCLRAGQGWSRLTGPPSAKLFSLVTQRLSFPGDEPSKFAWRPSAIAGAGLVPRYHQMEAAIGWLPRNSGRSNEGRVSWSWLKENSGRSTDAALRRRSGFP